MLKPVKCKSEEDFAINNFCLPDPWLAPYKYPSYPPPIPLWAAGKLRRKFIPYFGKDYTTAPPSTTTTTTTTGRPESSSCLHLPSSCRSSPPYLPLPLECIGKSSLLQPSSLTPDWPRHLLAGLPLRSPASPHHLLFSLHRPGKPPCPVYSGHSGGRTRQSYQSW